MILLMPKEEVEHPVAKQMRLRSWLRILIASAMTDPDDEQRLRLHARAIAVTEYQMGVLE